MAKIAEFGHKGAFIIYLEGGYDYFEGGHSFSLVLFRGAWKIYNKNDIEHRGANHFFPEKEKGMKMLLDAIIIRVFYFKMLFIYFKMLIHN